MLDRRRGVEPLMLAGRGRDSAGAQESPTGWGRAGLNRQGYWETNFPRMSMVGCPVGTATIHYFSYRHFENREALKTLGF
jgi:hypothetical protein